MTNVQHAAMHRHASNARAASRPTSLPGATKHHVVAAAYPPTCYTTKDVLSVPHDATDMRLKSTPFHLDRSGPLALDH